MLRTTQNARVPSYSSLCPTMELSANFETSKPSRTSAATWASGEGCPVDALGTLKQGSATAMEFSSSAMAPCDLDNGRPTKPTDTDASSSSKAMPTMATGSTTWPTAKAFTITVMGLCMRGIGGRTSNTDKVWKYCQTSQHTEVNMQMA